MMVARSGSGGNLLDVVDFSELVEVEKEESPREDLDPDGSNVEESLSSPTFRRLLSVSGVALADVRRGE